MTAIASENETTTMLFIKYTSFGLCGTQPLEETVGQHAPRKACVQAVNDLSAVLPMTNRIRSLILTRCESEFSSRNVKVMLLSTKLYR